MRRLFIAEEIILELVHTGVREHQCRVILYNNGCGRHDLMPFAAEKIKELLAYLCAGHHKENAEW